MDAGTTTCGTGENALHVASLGLSVLGVDVAETALAIARKKADDRGVEIEFAAADAVHLERLGRMSKTVLDFGLFHSFTGDERPGYVASLSTKATRVERGRHCYAIKFVLGLTLPAVSSLVKALGELPRNPKLGGPT